MKQQRWGRIINIGSEVLARGIGHFSPYVAAKGAQNGWTRSMATELAPYGVTVNMISPGWIPVERHAGASQSKIDSYQSGVPVGRMGVPEDLAGSVAFPRKRVVRFRYRSEHPRQRWCHHFLIVFPSGIEMEDGSHGIQIASEYRPVHCDAGLPVCRTWAVGLLGIPWTTGPFFPLQLKSSQETSPTRG